MTAVIAHLVTLASDFHVFADVCDWVRSHRHAVAIRIGVPSD